MTFDSGYLAERSRDSDSGNAALRAASLSFSGSSGPPLPPRSNAIQTGEAFLAANKARLEPAYIEPVKQPLRRTSTEAGPPLPFRPQLRSLQNQTDQASKDISQSPSGIAALLAAERFSPTHQNVSANGGSYSSTNHNPNAIQKRQTWAPQDQPVPIKKWLYEPQEEELDIKVDARPLQRLDTLISTFDEGRRREDLKIDTAPAARAANIQPQIHSPIPRRPVKPQNIPLAAALLAAKKDSQQSASSSRDSSSGPGAKSFSLIAAHSVSPDAPTPGFSSAGKTQYRFSNSSLNSVRPGSNSTDFKQSTSVNVSEESIALLTESDISSAEKLPQQVALSSVSRKSPAPVDSMDFGTLKPATTSLSPPQIPERLEPSFTGSSMRDAIAASSLASSRAASPLQAIPIQSREHHRRGHSIQKMFSPPRSTPSPTKGMRMTLRSPIPQQKTGEESDQPQSRKGLHKKHPNKHKEGDRKRWQEALTETERRRYEALWAANRGHLISLVGTIVPQQISRKGHTNYGQGEEMVLDLVVRDIWLRSRLSPDILSEIWGLVNFSAVGMLSKTEFIVGTWLIDQCLKGKKPPARVSESIWASVEHSEELRTRAQGLI